MNTKILAFAGSKQAGKSTCSNFLHGYQLCAQEVVEDFGITEQGRLFVKTNVLQPDGKEKLEDTYLDVNRRDQEYVEWAMYNAWPFVKKYSFADSLKELAINLFGLTYEQVYGSEAHKQQQVPHLRWENMPGVIIYGDDAEYDELYGSLDAWGQADSLVWREKGGPMTVRDFLQYLGTDVCRKIYNSVWVDRCINDIKHEEPLLAIIDDCRFENEIKAVKEAGGKVIGLTRQPYEDTHSSERVVQDHAGLCDAVIDNEDLEIKGMCEKVIEHIDSWGWLSEVKVNHKKETLRSIKNDQ